MKNECNEVVMVSGCRTAIGNFGGALREVRANELTKITVTEAIRRAGIEPKDVDEIIQGTGCGAGNGNLPPRIVAMQIGMDVRSGATIVSQNCASGMRALDVAAMKLALGQTQIAVVVGTESQSTTPYLLPAGMRWGVKMNHLQTLDPLFVDGMMCQCANVHMGVTAENVAELYGITREECDAYAVMSNVRACRAIDRGYYKEEIVPVEIRTRKGTQIFDTDEHPVRNASLEQMAKLPPAFKKGGIVTAANSSAMNDASAAVVLMTKKKAKELGIPPLLKLLSSVTEGVAPEIMGVGPTVAVPKALAEAGLGYDDVDYWELNEAFAAQVLGTARMIKEKSGIDMNFGSIAENGNINSNGSGISIGHPIGATGVRMLITAYYELKRLSKTICGTTLCAAAGPAMASIWTRDF